MDELSSQSHASCTCTEDFDSLREKLKLRMRIQSELHHLREALVQRECDLLTELEVLHAYCGSTKPYCPCFGQLDFQSDFDAWKQQLEKYGQLVAIDQMKENQLTMGAQTDTGEDELNVDFETFEFVDFATPETKKWKYQMVSEAEREENEKEEAASCCSVDSFDVIRADCSGVKVDDSAATKPQLASTPAVHPTSGSKSNPGYPTFYLPNLQKREQNKVARELEKIENQKNALEANFTEPKCCSRDLSFSAWLESEDQKDALEANVTEPKCCSRDLSYSAWLESEDQKDALEANVGPAGVYRQLEKIENQKIAEDQGLTTWLESEKNKFEQNKSVLDGVCRQLEKIKNQKHALETSVTESKCCSGGLGLNDWLKISEANVTESKCCSGGQGNAWLRSENQKSAWLKSENQKSALEASVTESKFCSGGLGLNDWLKFREANATESKCCSVGQGNAWLRSENQKTCGTPADALKASFQTYLQGGGVSTETWVRPKGEKEYKEWVAKKSPSKGVGTYDDRIVVTLSRQLKSFAM